MEKEEFLKVVLQHSEYLPDVFKLFSQMLEEYKDKCEKRNNILLREALGDACTIMSHKRRPSKEDMKIFSGRIERAIFPNGLEPYHHTGEKNFYDIYLKD